MKIYHDLLRHILEKGEKRDDRTGVGTLSSFGHMMRFNLEEGFPAITTKKLFFKSVVAELIGFIKGVDNYNDFNKLGTKIWDANGESDYWKPKAKKQGDLGRIYGVQWRHWRNFEGEEFDQLADVISRIKSNPVDRRMIVTAWNPGEINMMALPPCHLLFQFYVSNGNKLSLMMYQRSADMFLGVPFNIASYSLLLCMVAQVTNLVPSTFVHVLGDAHIYLNHIEQVKEQLLREEFPLPTLHLNKEIKNIDDFKIEDVTLENYVHHPAIKGEMAI